MELNWIEYYHHLHFWYKTREAVTLSAADWQPLFLRNAIYLPWNVTTHDSVGCDPIPEICFNVEWRTGLTSADSMSGSSEWNNGSQGGSCEGWEVALNLCPESQHRYSTRHSFLAWSSARNRSPCNARSQCTFGPRRKVNRSTQVAIQRTLTTRTNLTNPNVKRSFSESNSSIASEEIIYHLENSKNSESSRFESRREYEIS
jgi:hypothetical protein